jgi:hypothetical protein
MGGFMKPRIIVMVLFCLAVLGITGCGQFNKTVNGLGTDMLFSAENTNDGGYILAGMTSAPAGDIQAWLVKVDSKGKKTMEYQFGGSGTEVAYSAQQTADGGYIFAGSTTSKGAGAADVWLIRIDANDNYLWDKTFGGVENDMGYCVRQTSDGGYIIAGVTLSKTDPNGDFWLIKTDVNGNMLWDKTFGGPDIEYAFSVLQTADGGYLITGDTHSYGAGGEDVWLVKTDADGNMSWDKTYGGAEFDSPNSIIETKDGGYIIAGITFSYGAGGEDAWLIKTDADGNMLWDKTYGGSDDDAISSVKETKDGGYIIAGWTTSSGAGGMDMWLIKTDAAGDKLWDKTFGGANTDVACSALLTSVGGYLLAGTTLSYGDGNGDAWLIKTDAKGKAPAAPK